MKKENLKVISAYKGMRSYVEMLKGNSFNEAKKLMKKLLKSFL